MSQRVRAVWQRGAFRPLQPVSLPENAEVELEVVGEERGEMRSIYAILGERYESGEPDVAARHDEHQP